MSLFQLTQKYNLLTTLLDKTILNLKNSTPQPTITPIAMINSVLTVDMRTISNAVFSLHLNANLANIVFRNSVVNGTYIIYLYGTGQIVRKHLGANIMNNLSGDTVVNGVFSVNVYYDGTNYYLNFVNYTA